MANIRVEVRVRKDRPVAALDRLLAALAGPGKENLTRDGAEELKTAVILHAPERTGALKQSVEITPRGAGDTGWLIGPDTDKIPYAVIQNYGGTIVPRPGNTLGADGQGRLVFRLWGRLIFARSVTIPAQHYMDAALQEGAPRAFEAVKAALNRQA